MKTTSIFVPSLLEVGTKEWHENRRNYITASECGAIMQLSPFTPAAKIFYLKLGLLQDDELQNEAVHWGRQLENLIINDWQSHTGEEKSYLKKEKQREAERIQGYYTTKEYPFLASTPDAIFSQFSLKILPDGNIERTPMSEYCPLEVKSISQWSAGQWQAGIPPFYLCQITLQMICQNLCEGCPSTLFKGSSTSWASSSP